MLAILLLVVGFGDELDRERPVDAPPTMRQLEIAKPIASTSVALEPSLESLQDCWVQRTRKMLWKASRPELGKDERLELEKEAKIRLRLFREVENAILRSGYRPKATISDPPPLNHPATQEQQIRYDKMRSRYNKLLRREATRERNY